jgi:hypothetical protein
LSSQVKEAFAARVNAPARKRDSEPNHALFVNCTTHLCSHAGRFGAPPAIASRCGRRLGQVFARPAAKGSFAAGSWPAFRRDEAMFQRSCRTTSYSEYRSDDATIIDQRSDRSEVPTWLSSTEDDSHQYNYLPTCFDYAAAGSALSDIGRGADSDRSGAHRPTLPETDLPAIVRCSARRGVDRRSHILAHSLKASNIRCRNAIGAQLQIRAKYQSRHSK